MVDLSFLPRRQKIIIGVVFVTGLLLLTCSVFKLSAKDTLNNLILYYSIGVPLALLFSNTIIDLNDNRIFAIWLSMGITLWLISLTTYSNERFMMNRGVSFDNTEWFNRNMALYSTSSLKALLFLLIGYFIVNKLYNRKGLFVVNTYRQPGWYHDIARRKITGLDVAVNFLLMAFILIGFFFGR